MMFDFVIQEHTRDEDVHWDLMVRSGERLFTWHVCRHPNQWAECEFKCEKIFDHRLKYLTYEGPISDGRGYVRIVARGQYIDIKGKLLTCLPFDELDLVLNGDLVSGNLSLSRISDDNWNMTFTPKTVNSYTITQVTASIPICLAVKQVANVWCVDVPLPLFQTFSVVYNLSFPLQYCLGTFQLHCYNPKQRHYMLFLRPIAVLRFRLVSLEAA